MSNIIPVDTVLSTAYFPPIDYFVAIAKSKLAKVETCENYQKQTYRNRCNISTPTGVLSLSIPIKKTESSLISDIEIDYSKPWLQQHQRALVSAYASSPFFEYYQDEIFAMLEYKEKYLLDLNTNLLRTIVPLCGLNNELQMTSVYTPSYPEEVKDYRSLISPKKPSPIFEGENPIKEKPYYQVFSQQQGYLSNLSILDLLFNEGPNAISFLI